MATDTAPKTSTGSSNGDRKFELIKATRTSIPIWIGLGGGSGGGKTMSALRLATGIQRVVGGRISVIDTEAKRARVYAPKEGDAARPPDTFDFDQLPFEAPFGSADYLAAIRHCYAAGSRIVIVDSFSHEHEGPGGVLEQFEDELERISDGDEDKANRMKFTAWQKPKAARRRMINEMLQMQLCVIGCFRTKNALEIKKGEDPKKKGEIPVTDAGFIYEFPLRLLIKAGTDGHPALSNLEFGERNWVRVPQFFRHLISEKAQLSESIGEEVAKWAAGALDENSPYVRLTRAIAAARDKAALETIKAELEAIAKKKSIPASEFRILREAFAARVPDVKAIENEAAYDTETGEVKPPVEPVAGDAQ